MKALVLCGLLLAGCSLDSSELQNGLPDSGGADVLLQVSRDGSAIDTLNAIDNAALGTGGTIAPIGGTGGTPVVLRAQGDGCLSNDQCAGGLCTATAGTPGVCCDAACKGKPCFECTAKGACVVTAVPEKPCGSPLCEALPFVSAVNFVCRQGACIRTSADCRAESGPVCSRTGNVRVVLTGMCAAGRDRAECVEGGWYASCLQHCVPGDKNCS